MPQNSHAKNAVVATAQKVDLIVSAHLVYNDGSVSRLDVLHNDTLALWNTPAGGGDAEQPSGKVQLNLQGDLSGLGVTVCNGNRKTVYPTFPSGKRAFVTIINNTGCEVITVRITNQQNVVYEKQINFHCGE